MQRTVKHISELPADIADQLYEHRLDAHHDMPKEDYLGLFRFVSLNDETAYAADGEQWRTVLWLGKRSLYNATVLPDAVFMNGLLIKNRYGCSAY